MPSYSVYRESGARETWSNLTTKNWSNLAKSVDQWIDFHTVKMNEDDIFRFSVDRGWADVFSRLRAGEATIAFDNWEGNYSPETSSGMKLEEYINIRATTDAGSEYNLFKGHVKNVTINPNIPERTAVVRAEDNSSYMRKRINLFIRKAREISDTFREVSESTELGNALADDTGLKPRFVFFDNEPAGNIINQIKESGGHFVFMDANGRLNLRKRGSDNPSSLTTVSSFNEFLQFDYSLDDSRIINEATIRSTPRKEANSATSIALLKNVPEIEPNGDINFFLPYRSPLLGSDLPVTEVAAPVAGKDFGMNTSSDGTGSETTANADVTVKAFANAAFIRISNTKSQTMFVNSFQLRGTPVVEGTPFQGFSQVESSSIKHGNKDLSIDNPLLTNEAEAQSYATHLVERYKDAEADIAVTMRNEFPDIIKNDIFDLIGIEEGNTGVSNLYLISGLRHNVIFENKGNVHTVEYDLIKPKS